VSKKLTTDNCELRTASHLTYADARGQIRCVSPQAVAAIPAEFERVLDELCDEIRLALECIALFGGVPIPVARAILRRMEPAHAAIDLRLAAPRKDELMENSSQFSARSVQSEKPLFEALADQAMHCAQGWREWAVKVRDGMQSRSAVALSALFIQQNVLFTLMADREKERLVR
jgi:hypothetical protein